MTGWDTRAQAGLRPPQAISTNINPTHGVAGHYGGSGPFKRSSHSACRAIWRGWQDFHMSPSNANNYNDIAYNLGVCHHDIVLEGRSTRSRPIVRGGANGNFTVNTNRYSVVAIWGANDGAWPDSLKRAWRFARDWLRKQDRRTGTGLTPHSAMSSTGCPGGPGRAFLAAGAPYPGSTPQPQEDDVSKADVMAGLNEFFGQKAGVYNDAPMTRDDALALGRFAGYSQNLLKYTVLPELAAIRAAAGGQPVDEEALAQRLASLLLPEVGDQIRAELAEVDGVDEDAVATAIVARVGAKLTAPDA